MHMWKNMEMSEKLEIVIYTIVIIEEQLLSLFSLFRRKWELLENLPSCA